MEEQWCRKSKVSSRPTETESGNERRKSSGVSLFWLHTAILSSKKSDAACYHVVMDDVLEQRRCSTVFRELQRLELPCLNRL